MFTLSIKSNPSTVKFCVAFDFIKEDDFPCNEIRILSLFNNLILRNRTWFELVMVIILLVSESPELSLIVQFDILTSSAESMSRRLCALSTLFIWKAEFCIRIWLARNTRILFWDDDCIGSVDVIFVKTTLSKMMSVFRNWKFELCTVDREIMARPSVVVMFEESRNTNPVNCVKHSDTVKE